MMNEKNNILRQFLENTIIWLSAEFRKVETSFGSKKSGTKIDLEINCSFILFHILFHFIYYT